jgi:hypothetical protein
MALALYVSTHMGHLQVLNIYNVKELLAAWGSASELGCLECFLFVECSFWKGD